MTTHKIIISEEKFDINMCFYFFLKHLIKTALTENQTNAIFNVFNLYSSLSWEEKKSYIVDEAEKIKGKNKKNEFINVLDRIDSSTSLKLFLFSLNLYNIKGLLLEEAKLKNSSINHKLSILPPLSLEYDRLSLITPYATRVNGAILALIFFDNLENGETNFISDLAHEHLEYLSKSAIYFKSIGVEPNQIFMLVFNESINQSITSNSGLNYEKRIEGVLINVVGLQPSAIKKTHDKDDGSTEFDFLFNINGRSYGVGAKKTLRERYKQFIKTSLTSNIDVMIEITIGLDLNKAKAETIRKHGTYIFLSDEIYNKRQDLIDMYGVFPTNALTRETLISLK